LRKGLCGNAKKTVDELTLTDGITRTRRCTRSEKARFAGSRRAIQPASDNSSTRSSASPRSSSTLRRSRTLARLRSQCLQHNLGDTAPTSFFYFTGRPGTMTASARSTTAIHRGTRPLTPETMARTRASMANMALIDMNFPPPAVYGCGSPLQRAARGELCSDSPPRSVFHPKCHKAAA
jgi:hypothetical protein